MDTNRARHAGPPPVPRAGARATAARTAEVVIVTHDAELESTLRESSPTTPIRLATTPAALADLLMTGRAGALVLDARALDAAALTVARHLAEQFPEVPLVAVGSREDEARLAGLISAGLVYRFLHRPLSVARARTFIDAALRRGHERGSGARAPRPAAPPRRDPRPLIVAGATAIAALGVWLALRPLPAAPPARNARGVAPSAHGAVAPPAAAAKSAEPATASDPAAGAAAGARTPVAAARTGGIGRAPRVAAAAVDPPSPPPESR